MYRRLFIGSIIFALISLPLVGAKVPRAAPALTFNLPGSGQMNLAQFRGKVVALEFLLTTCPHCKRTSGVVQKIYQELGPKGFQALGVAINDGADKLIPAYRLELNLTYPVGYTHRDRAIDFLQHPIMLTLWVPQLVIIDKQGQIRGQYAGTDEFFKNEEANMRKIIEQLLAE